MANSDTFEPLRAGAGQDTDGTPRNSTLLRDVAYWIDAYPLVFDAGFDNTPMKYVEMLKRRVEKGQCYTRPYLGCREFAAEFSPPLESDKPIGDSMEIGRMLYDIAFRGEGQRAAFFEARLVEGVMDTRPEVVLANPARCQEVLACSYRH
jgi:CRISPR-associated protein Cas5d